MSLHENKRLWQKHVLAENRRSIQGLLDTLCDEPVYKVMATSEEHRGKWMGVEATGRKIELPLTIVFPMKDGQILGERLYYDMRTLMRCLGQ